MEKYIAPEMEIVAFENEDILTGSGCQVVGIPIGCATQAGTCGLEGLCIEVE